MKKAIFVLLLLAGLQLLVRAQLAFAEDVKVKLTTDDGSTSFQVRDKNEVVVSSITSVGDAAFGGDVRVKGNDIFFGTSQTDRKIYDDSSNYATRFSSNVYIEQGALRNRTVKNEDLVITSTFTLDTGNVTTDSNVWSDMPNMRGTLNITAAPATIFLYFNGTVFRTISENQYPKVAVRFNVDDTSVGYGEFMAEQDGFPGKCPLGMNAAYTVSTTGSKVVKVEWRSGDDDGAYGTANAYDRHFSAFWFGAP